MRYLDSETLPGDGTQLMIGFGGDAELCDAADLPAVQASLDEILPGYEVLDATAHDWLADEFSPPLAYSTARPAPPRRHAPPRGQRHPRRLRPHNGWAGFIDGAIESDRPRARGLGGEPLPRPRHRRTSHSVPIAAMTTSRANEIAL